MSKNVGKPWSVFAGHIGQPVCRMPLRRGRHGPAQEVNTRMVVRNTKSKIFPGKSCRVAERSSRGAPRGSFRSFTKISHSPRQNSMTG